MLSHTNFKRRQPATLLEGVLMVLGAAIAALKRYNYPPRCTSYAMEHFRLEEDTDAINDCPISHASFRALPLCNKLTR